VGGWAVEHGAGKEGYWWSPKAERLTLASIESFERIESDFRGSSNLKLGGTTDDLCQLFKDMFGRRELLEFRSWRKRGKEPAVKLMMRVRGKELGARDASDPFMELIARV
jgi:hypothetical protein